MQQVRLIVLALLTLVWYCVGSSGTAQEASQYGADELSRAVQSQDLDSYWLDQNTWMEYGYRPHVKAQVTPFTNLPRYGAAPDSYAFGSNPPLPTPLGKNPYDKQSVQLTKYGTWH